MTPKYEETEGNLFEAGLPAIGHGCNTTGLMGAGIAAEFRRRWPEMYTQYNRRCLAGLFPLGSYMVWAEDPLIFNLATQNLPGPHAKLSAIYKSARSALRACQRAAIPALGLPRVGCGYGGLNWPEVRSVLQMATERIPVRLVIVSLPEASISIPGEPE